jgi:hypothetical protein
MQYLRDLNVMVLPLAFVAVVLSVSFIRGGKPSAAILARWSLWFFAAAGSAILLGKFHISSKPMWATALFCWLLWMLMETLYNWVAIDALSRSGLPLFPKYKLNDNGSEWPAGKTFIALRETLRNLQMHFVASAVGQLGSDECVRCPVYENADKTQRITIYFIPTSGGTLQAYYSIGTLLDDGRRIVTDNVYIPFGGFYPENMLLERRPLVRSLKRLMKLHDRRLLKIGGKAVQWSVDPVADLNSQQEELEQLNVNLGFLVEPALREEYGNISREGRYRLWKEIWMLNYLGKPFSY